VDHIASKFRNVTLCDDVRDEMGNKKSLMGVISGDVLVPSLPATIQIAIYFEYVPDENEPESMNLSLRLFLDEISIASIGMQAHLTNRNPVTFVLPKGLATFEKPATFKVSVSVNNQPEEEILSKKILVSPSASATASPPPVQRSQPSSREKAS
jgi:Family of unknown function (DUF6941)